MRCETRIKLFWLLAVAILTAIVLRTEARPQTRRTLNSPDVASRLRPATAAPKQPRGTKISSAIISTRRLLPGEQAAETVIATGVSVAAQSCTLVTQGYAGSPAPVGLGTVNLRWFTRTAPSQIQEFRIFAGWAVNVPAVGYFTASGSALGYTVNYLCPVNGGPVTIQEVRTNGTICSVAYTGNLPHGGCNGGGAGAGVSVVSAANYRGNVTRGAIVSVFPDPGVTFTSATETARVLPLPVSLGGVSVTVSGIPCGLFYVSPGQLNILLPENLPDGPAEVSLTVTASDGRQLYGKPQVNPQAPGIFTITGDGGGQAAAVWYGGGVVSLFATGIHSNQATLFLTDGRQVEAQYVGVTPGFAGLNQLNFVLPRPSVAIGAFVRVWAATGYYDTQGFLLR